MGTADKVFLFMRKSFIIHFDSLAVLDDLTPEQAGQLFKAIKAYHLSEPFHLDVLTRIAFAPFKAQFERDEEKYDSVCDRNRNNGLKGGRPKKEETQDNPNNPSGFLITQDNPTEPKKADSDSDSKNESKKEIKEPIGFQPFDFFGIGIPFDHRKPESMREASRVYWGKGEKKYSKEQWDKFLAYWEAKTKRGKMKWQSEETFDIPQRIRRFGEPIENKNEPPKQVKYLYP